MHTLLFKHKPPITVDASGGSSFLLGQIAAQCLILASGEDISQATATENCTPRSTPGRRPTRGQRGVLLMRHSSILRNSRMSWIFDQIVATLKGLVHPNIAPIFGTTVRPSEPLSNWLPGGDLPGYIAKYPYADKLSLVRPLHTILRNVLIPSLAIWRRRGSKLPTLLQWNSWRSQRGV